MKPVRMTKTSPIAQIMMVVAGGAAVFGIYTELYGMTDTL